MKKMQPMRRLLQGDVARARRLWRCSGAGGDRERLPGSADGSDGDSGDAALSFARKLLANAISPATGKPYRVTLLTGSLDEAAKREARGRIFRGETDLAIGTHALIEDKVEFENLGLVIVDEQHRFGVQQRFKLMRKPNAEGVSSEPDVLVMTATPIRGRWR